MAEMTGAQAFFEVLLKQGVRYVFGNPGTTELPIMDLFAARDDITYILALHEDCALGMAVGYAEATGRAAVVNLHANPGLAHALGNLYNAHRAGTPLVVTAGQQDTRFMIEEPLLCADMIQMASQYTKWAWEVRSAAEIPRAMARAFQIALAPPTGPVFLSLPVDALEGRADMKFEPITRIGRARPDRSDLQEAASLILNAQNPAIIAGDRCARSGAVGALIQLAEIIGARVHAEPLNSLLVFPTGHPLYAGPLFPNTKQAQAALSGVDLVILIGVNNMMPLVYTGDKMIPEGARIIQIDSDTRELGKNYSAELAMPADPLLAIEDLVQIIRGRADREAMLARREQVAAALAQMRARFAESAASDAEPLEPAFVARQMRRIAPDAAVLVDESVTSTAFLRTFFELNEPNSYFYAKGGSLGLGLPAAIGVKLAMPDRQVICAVGDGSALYSIQSLWTAAHYKLPVRFIIFNNSSYMILKGGLLAMRGESVRRQIFTGMDIADPEIDFVKLAQSMGVAAQRVARAQQLEASLQWAINESGPALLDIAITRDVRSVLQ
jgi:benzoylformate decarboxylase